MRQQYLKKPFLLQMLVSFNKKNLVRAFLKENWGRSGYLSLSMLGLSVMLSSCALSTEKQTPASESKVVQEVTPLQKPSNKLEVANISLDSASMFEILAAEMMMQKGQSASAFEVLYPLAVQTKDKALAERVFQIAMASYDVANIEKATQHWKTVDPQSAIAWRASFLLTLRQHNVTKALDEWQTYFKLANSSLADELIGTATKVASTVPKESGTEFFQALTQMYPNEWAAYYGLGMVSIVYQNPEVGIVALEKAKPLLPKTEYEKSLPVFYNLLSKLYLMSNEPERGIEAIAPYLETSPDDLLIQERMARLEVQAKRYADAERRYKYILKAEPEARTSQLSLALIQMELKEYDAAEQNLLELKQNKLYESVSQYYLGILYQDNGRNALAIEMFEAVKGESYVLDAQLHLAEIYFAQKDSQKAFAILNGINAKNIEDKIKVLRAKAIFSSADKNIKEAVALYDQALKLDNNNIELLKAQSLLLYKLGMFDEYETNLLNVLKVNESDSDVLNALGYYYVEQNIKLEQAYVLLQKALSLESNSYYILDSLGWYFYQIKKFNKALEYLNKAFAIEKDDEVLIHLVTTYWQNNEINRAKSLWKKYHQLFLQNDRVQNLINELELGNSK